MSGKDDANPAQVHFAELLVAEAHNGLYYIWNCSGGLCFHGRSNDGQRRTADFEIDGLGR